ncbi:2-C-methyl-D-erythritol 4-phosphate cytidylyltransferase/2-C-methyl-D-erythritol 2,4-cyclodiphosphate synthase [Azospirillum fermentarium]|uniref:bifunctional 2-C-methyl-D-erythritol 4-phosphate cytidylyltransferase/2-C-methyl-D-erythritol 2,4-cyclodiphosphate synthase n=1 Tax=Azospirillum fermentarium TaxID=1233114 RepID=UPI002225CE8A|nr:bifunctional 2-C-methyl-D-erythritol 4-phosphate cytidylyltransferase/2-C-methyl-D-erythritol 2,4-cyclodiphosphate synthase [Azospirillum fermentarium]MCW2246456.1 2-C-methyl-D-erythritol 4-phosphate cytidylyltransferase/2-C-methyl-D-erythritol 2,4-cyclodiphosphate synthase [Azospirillum fermentarium]
MTACSAQPSRAVPTCAVLIVAAGSGQRFGPGRPKQYHTLGGCAVLRRTIGAFTAHPGVGTVLAVINPGHRDLYDAATAGLDLPEPVPGGASRQDSVRHGLERLAALPCPPDRVLIHDGARPIIAAETIAAVIAALDHTPGAVAAVPVIDTLKRADGGTVAGTVDRAGLWRAQTPQGFRFPDILAAHRAAAGLELTDDAAVAERAGLAVSIVPGREENIKVTTPDDLTRAERLLNQSLTDVRVGTGFDVHRFAPGDEVFLCGVKVPHTHTLDGHSDADVALHALTDALLGAIGDGDIGSHFPPSDPQWKGADSARFLRHAAGLVAARGGRIAHVDVTVVCERPKVGPHRAAMVARVAELLALDPSRVSVKATTTERLGFTGRGEGIAAQAVATVRLPEQK